ncbi:MAG TPA: hypothetical protein ENO16_02610 [Chromatiales bacterium]|nr:hypothetical protein [Chromatiales bacterium]
MRKQAPILLLRPHRSPTLTTGILVIHGLGVLSLWLSSLPALAALGVSLTLVTSAMLAWNGMQQVEELQWVAGETWRLVLADGKPRRALLDVHASLSLPWWATLAFRLEGGGRLSIMLPRDSLPSDDFRRLRVRLRVEAGSVQKRGRMEPVQPGWNEVESGAPGFRGASSGLRCCRPMPCPRTISAACVCAWRQAACRSRENGPVGASLLAI